MKPTIQKLNQFATVVALLLTQAAFSPSAAAQSTNQKLQEGKLGIRKVEANASVAKAAASAGKADSLGRVVEALDAQLIAAFNDTGKYEVVAWSDLKDVIQTQEVNATFGGQGFQYAGCRYSVMVKIDDFQDFERVTQIQALGKTYSQRQVRVSAVVIIYDNTDGSVLRTTTVSATSELVPEQVDYNGDGPRTTDALLQAVAKEISRRTVWQVSDVIFPMRVVAREDDLLTLNRGQAFMLAPGMEFEVFSAGQEMIDPDTGRSLGRREQRIGKARIERVDPQTSTAKILDGGSVAPGGIERGSVLRLPQQ